MFTAEIQRTDFQGLRENNGPKWLLRYRHPAWISVSAEVIETHHADGCVHSSAFARPRTIKVHP
jgi:hypothetical protein